MIRYHSYCWLTCVHTVVHSYAMFSAHVDCIPMYTMLSSKNQKNSTYRVIANVDCTYWKAMASFTVAWEKSTTNSYNPFGLANSFQKQKVLKPNNRTDHALPNSNSAKKLQRNIFLCAQFHDNILLHSISVNFSPITPLPSNRHPLQIFQPEHSWCYALT